MKVLFCSPYIQSAEYTQGGVNIWGANIISHYKSLEKITDVELKPISFDRKTYSEIHCSQLVAFFNGIQELWHPVLKTVTRIKKGDVDAVHICTNTGRSMLKDLLIIYYGQKHGVRSYVHFHCGTIPLVLAKGGFYRKIMLSVLAKATKGITMDMRSYKALTDCGVTNVVNLPNPLSLSIIEQVNAAKDSIHKVPGRITFVGHVLRSKGIFELIECCCRIGQPDLHIIGKVLPEDRAAIDTLLKKKNTDGSWITWTGEISHERVLEELLATEIFAFPSYSEGFPNVILEAMACKCAIVTTAVGAIPEMLDIGGDPCGICTTPCSADAFYESLIAVYTNPALITQLSNKAAYRVNEQYRMDKVWRRLIEIWK